MFCISVELLSGFFSFPLLTTLKGYKLLFIIVIAVIVSWGLQNTCGCCYISSFSFYFVSIILNNHIFYAESCKLRKHNVCLIIYKVKREKETVEHSKDKVLLQTIGNSRNSINFRSSKLPVVWCNGCEREVCSRNCTNLV